MFVEYMRNSGCFPSQEHARECNEEGWEARGDEAGDATDNGLPVQELASPRNAELQTAGVGTAEDNWWRIGDSFSAIFASLYHPTVCVISSLWGYDLVRLVRHG